ncbi:3-isopropylmalate dehydratase subunit LeuD [Gammaproteobacteria bacterium]
MQPFTTLDGLVVPLDRANVDTDAIIPKQFLKSIRRTGFGPYLFDEWRYLDHGEPDMDCTSRPRNPDFVLNQPHYQGAQVLLARANFGCGSSREHAPWAIADYGLRALIAPSFADIFYNNCFKNGLLPIILTEEIVDRLFCELAKTIGGYRLQIDLTTQTITAPGWGTISFSIDPHRRHCLLHGLDDIELTLQHAKVIRAYEARRRLEAPWLFS